MIRPTSQGHAQDLLNEGIAIRAAIRVPVYLSDGTNTGRWLYFRCWNQMGRWWGRSHMGGIGSVSAVEAYQGQPAYGKVGEVGLEYAQIEMDSSMTAEQISVAVDRYLFRLGVLDGEWPGNCVGAGYREDRPPFSLRWAMDDLGREEARKLVFRGSSRERS